MFRILKRQITRFYRGKANLAQKKREEFLLNREKIRSQFRKHFNVASLKL